MTVIIIPCGFKKRAVKCRASELYQGPYFNMNLKWARSVAADECIFILSAKHGFLRLNNVVEPYDLKMGQSDCISPDTVSMQASILGLYQATIYAVGGEKYLTTLKEAGLQFCAPVKGLPMGKSMGALKKNLGKLPEWTCAR